ncbi:MAG: branched-chain amino acid ABC transporter permease [Chloroflexi bacterium]|nr:MAG: branched-chain amino acid ABC transporter permease [Chloroflexota bacterium]TME92962.1 MAG: branched-chain amino acid ABC transporter permease [Chloroflexota bacterium]
MSVGDFGFFVICLTAIVLLAAQAVVHPSEFAQILVFGLADGAIYALVALGYTMVYGIIELINFAHGDVFTLGAYVAAAVMGFFAGTSEDTFSVSNLVALLVTFPAAMLLMGAVNITIERVAYRPLRNAPRLAPLITAIGMSFLLEGIMFVWSGPFTVHVPDLLPHGPGFNTTIGGVFIEFKDVFVVVAAAILVSLLAVFINRSKLGKAMRATAQDRDASQLMGININRTIAATFFIGALLAGAGGVIWGLYFNAITYNLGFRTGLVAFTSAVFGGIGNIPGAALGGMVIGLTAAFSDAYIGSKWTQVVIFGILIGVLVFRPTGLLGMRVPEK